MMIGHGVIGGNQGLGPDGGINEGNGTIRKEVSSSGPATSTGTEKADSVTGGSCKHCAENGRVQG